MAVAVGSVTTAALANGATSTTFSFTSTTDPLYLRVSGWTGGATTPTAVSFNGNALTNWGDSTQGSGGDFAQIWYRDSPGAATANIVVTHAGSSQWAGEVGVANITGLDGTTPRGTFVSSKSAGNGAATGSLSVAGNAAGDMTIACMANGNAAAVTPAATGGGTVSEEYDVSTNGERGEGFKVPDAATAVSASWTGNTSWALAAGPLNATAAATTVRTLALLGAGV